MVRFDSRSGSQRVDAETTEQTAATERTATTARAGTDEISKAVAKQVLGEMDGVVSVERSSGRNLAVAINKREGGTGKLRAAGLDVDTDADVVGSTAALEEKMQESEAFHFAAHTEAIHIETGIIVLE